jgi:chemotaxis protein MotB
MGRRKRHEEHTNHERWLVSYADFITLLFAFFVVMYSISQVNESKYRVLSNTLENAFNQPELAVEAIQIGDTAKSNPTNLIQLNDAAVKDKDGQGGEHENEMPDEFQQIANQIEQAFGDLMKQDMVTLRGNEEWLEVEMRSSLLFDSGDATLSKNALILLGQIAAILKEQKNAVRVEGFTDNVPIHTARYPSNWELSSARAAAVVQLFIEEGLDASRLVAAGYGEFQPVAANDTPDNRTRNRRVVLMISKSGELRPVLKAVAPKDQASDAAASGISIEEVPAILPPPAQLPGAAPAPGPAPASPLVPAPVSIAPPPAATAR